jgi:branched-chain amino acid transport system substrate-binding protein
MYRRVGPTFTASTPRGRRTRTAAAVLAAACAAAAGCSSAAGAIGAGGSASACATPGITAHRVNLGVLFPNSGPFASTFEGFRGAVDARIAVQNDKGGVHGRSITYDWADDGAGTNANLIGARTLVEQKNDFGIIEGSTNEQGSAPYLAQHGVPLTGVGPSTVWSSYSNAFSWTALSSPTKITTAWGQAAQQRGGTKVAVLSVVFIPSSQQLAQALATSMQANGLRVVYQNLQLSQTTNLAELAATVAQSHADVVTGVLSPQIWAALAPALRAAGATIKMSIFPNGYDQASLAQLGAAQAGTDFGLVTAPFELNLPADRAYLSAMAAYAPQVSPPQNQLALDGWLATDLMIRGLQEAGACPTRQSFTAALRKTTYNGDGLVNPPANLADYRTPSRCLYIVQVSPDGGSYQPQSTQPLCGQIHTRS